MLKVDEGRCYFRLEFTYPQTKIDNEVEPKTPPAPRFVLARYYTIIKLSI